MRDNDARHRDIAIGRDDIEVSPENHRLAQYADEIMQGKLARYHRIQSMFERRTRADGEACDNPPLLEDVHVHRGEGLTGAAEPTGQH